MDRAAVPRHGAPRMRRSACPSLLSLALLAAALGLGGCGAGDIDPEATARADAGMPGPATTGEPPLVEPTEDEMRVLAQAKVDQINAEGGFVIHMSGATSAPIKVRLTSFRKVGCTPYTRAFRCESLVGWAYPGSELPDEVLRASDRYTPDGKGGWTVD